MQNNLEQQQQQSPPQNINTQNIENSRFSKVQSELENVKLKYFYSYLSFAKNIVQKNLWRKEINEEILSHLTDYIPIYMKHFLKKKEKHDFSLIYKIQGFDEGQSVWYILQIDEDKKEQYFNDINLQDQTIDLDDYGKVLYSAFGEEIPENIMKDLHKKFFMQPSIKAKKLNELAWELQQSKNYEKSIQIYTQGIKLDDYNKTSFNNRGYSYMQLKNYDKAKEDFYKSIQIDRKFANPHKHLAFIFLQENYLQKAEIYCQRAIELKPDYWDACKMLQLIQQKIEQQNSTDLQQLDQNDNNDPYFNISKFNPNYYKQSPNQNNLFSFNNFINNSQQYQTQIQKQQTQNIIQQQNIHKNSCDSFDDTFSIYDKQSTHNTQSYLQNNNSSMHYESSNTIINNNSQKQKCYNSDHNYSPEYNISSSTSSSSKTFNIYNDQTDKINKKRKHSNFTFTNISVEKEKELEVIEKRIKYNNIRQTLRE